MAGGLARGERRTALGRPARNADIGGGMAASEIGAIGGTDRGKRMLGKGRRWLNGGRRVLKGTVEGSGGIWGGSSGGGTGSDGAVAAGGDAEMGGLRRFEHGTRREGVQRGATLVLSGLSWRKWDSVDSHVGEVGLTPGKEGFMRFLKASDHIKVAVDVFLHRGN